MSGGVENSRAHAGRHSVYPGRRFSRGGAVKGAAVKAEDFLGLMVRVTFVLFLITERLFPRRQYPPIRFWNLIGFGCLIMTGVIATLLPTLLPASLTQYHLIDGSKLGVVGGVLVGYALTALGSALLHRWFDEFQPLWRL